MKAFRSLLVVLLVAAIGILGAQWLGQESVRGIGEVIVRAGGNDYIGSHFSLSRQLVVGYISIAIVQLDRRIIARMFLNSTDNITGRRPAKLRCFNISIWIIWACHIPHIIAKYVL